MVICRICLLDLIEQDKIDIENQLNNDVTILIGIVQLSSIKVSDNDLKQYICKSCFNKLNICYNFRKQIIESDEKLKTLTQNHDENEPVQETKTNVSAVEIRSIKSEYSDNDDPSSDYGTIDSGDCNKNIFPDDQKHDQVEKEEHIVKRRQLNSKKLHYCKECQKSFKKADHLNVHIIYKHREKQFKCNTCNKKFARKYDLNYHNRIHTGERPFTCEICGKSFASSSYFYTHKKIHTGEKRNKCEFCSCAFINLDQLHIHIRQKHTGEKPFMCELCSSAFTSSSALFRHKRDVHGEKEPCPVCSKLYSIRGLKSHIKRHQEKQSGIKRFVCNICDKKFTCRTSIKRHKLIHNGNKDFKCEICKKAFNQRSTLQTHMRIHSQIMPFHCEICSKTFRYKHHLKLHMGKYHKSEDVKQE
ncbi:uncharacterized protein LOC143198293 [Rhynchophorus ferrugineus]|uniref:uncharacterized protein LOC143198293 n=1 Tax=Rhynchophorus ferrugineus TaxID=354439 RepID=UPI003FCE1BDF